MVGVNSRGFSHWPSKQSHNVVQKALSFQRISISAGLHCHLSAGVWVFMVH